MTSLAPDPSEVSAKRHAAVHAILAVLHPGMTVVLSTHISADGDGCGCEAAMARLLVQRGITPRIVNPTPWPATYDFLLGGDVVDSSSLGASALDDADVLMVLDISDVRRLGSLAEAVRSMRVPKLVIDHHIPSDDPPGDVMFADVTACATGELVFEFARIAGLAITPLVAEALYTAILTDTGGFRFSNTSPRCHRIAADLLAVGVDPERMYQRIYASAPIGRAKLLGEALLTLEADPEHGITWVSVPAGALERHEVRAEDLDGVVEHARAVAGTRMAIFFRDLGHGKVKASFRSIGSVDVNLFARQFGGGGHARAAGALVTGSLADVRESVVTAARLFLREDVVGE
ncbi:MAG: bifunctional oligoribonuclease/PAP phosphatase NrnA [Gemmatimonadaceae bacterium]